MASVTLQEAAKLSNNEVVEGIVEDIISQDNWFQYLPFVQLNGLSHTFKREKKLADVDFAGVGQDLTGQEYRGGATFENVNVGLAAIMGEILIDAQIDDQLSDIDDQLQVQVSSKSKAFARFFMNAIINYGSNAFALSQTNSGPLGIADFEQPPLMKGMKAILDEESGNADDVNHPFFNNGAPTQTIMLEEDDAASARFGKEGRTFTLEDLDAILDAVTKGPEFILMNKRMRRILRTLLRNTGGGTDAAQIMRQDLGSGKPMLHYQEIPVFISDFVSSVEPVHKLHSTAVTVSSVDVGASQITLSADISAQIAASLAGIKAVSDGIYLVVRAGAAAKFRKYTLKVTAVAGAVVTYDSAHVMLNDELNRLQGSDLTGLTSATGIQGKACSIYERVDGSSIYAGKFGEQEGLCGFTMMKQAGISVKYVGPVRERDQEQYRMKWYVASELYSRLALARLKGCLPLEA
jgi:hypothetical protein